MPLSLRNVSVCSVARMSPALAGRMGGKIQSRLFAALVTDFMETPGALTIRVSLDSGREVYIKFKEVC